MFAPKILRDEKKFWEIKLVALAKSDNTWWKFVSQKSAFKVFVKIWNINPVESIFRVNQLTEKAQKSFQKNVWVT